MVPVSPQCPREIVLPTLPVFQGTAVSRKRFSQSPPGNVVVLGGSLPLWRSLEQLDWLAPAGPLLQGTEPTALSIPEASLKSLIAWGYPHSGGSQAGSGNGTEVLLL